MLALGLAPYLYVPFAALGSPEINWGEATSIPRVMDHLLRVQYAIAAPGEVEPRLAFLIEQLVGQCVEIWQVVKIR